ncbi:MAG: NAD(P)-binding protein [Comamonadaceae bacterium]|nr:NAD(P)-binding protein [Comamonadaceae bacterium]
MHIDEYGLLALDLPAPKRAEPTGHAIAVIGGGPGGLSAAWQLALKGHAVDLYEAADKLGGKLEMCIPRERLPQEHAPERALALRSRLGVTRPSQEDRSTSGPSMKIYKHHEIVVVAVRRSRRPRC